MGERRTTARTAGALYFVFMLVSIYSEFLHPRQVVPGDASATAANIAAAALSYRFGIVIGLATLVIFLFLVVQLHKLLADVDRQQAMLMVVLVSVGVAVALANSLSRFAPLQLLSGDEYLSAFSQPQLAALALGSQRTRSAASLVPIIFWGLWLFPFGLLVMRSGFLPRVLGILLLVAGSAYLVTGTMSILVPEWRANFSRYLMPFYMGEVPIIFWLLIKGTRSVPDQRVGGASAT